MLSTLTVPGAVNPAGGPEISLTLRGVGDGRIEVGEPLLVAVRLDAAPDAAGPLQLAPARGTWVDDMEVELGRAGDRVVARAKAVNSPGQTAVSLGADTPVTGLWIFPESVLAALPVGEYWVQARLTIRDGTGWSGISESDRVALGVEDKSELPGRVVRRAWARAHAAVLANDLPGAVRIIDPALATYPDSFPLLVLRAQVCLQGDDVSSAQKCLARMHALTLRREGHPSVEMHELAQLILSHQPAPASAGAPAEWTRLPPSVLVPVLPVDGPGVPADPISSRSAVTLEARAATLGGQREQPVDFSPASRDTLPASSASVPPPSALSPSAPSFAVASSFGAIISAPELNDLTIRADAAGQWAVAATAGSQYGKMQYSAAKAVGAPDVPVVGNSPDAWCPAAQNTGTDWLEVTFAKPVHATEVRVRQNDKPGTIAKVEAIESDGTAHVWWEGVDPYVAPAARDIAWFAVRVPKTDYLVAKVRITLNLAAVPGWKEIDAVQLVGTDR